MDNITFEWSIQSLVADPITGVVERVYWIFTGTDKTGKVAQSLHGSYNLPRMPGRETQKDFTPHGELTKKQVIAWLNKQPNLESYKRQIAGAIRNTLAAQGNVPEENPYTGLPWEAKSEE